MKRFTLFVAFGALGVAGGCDQNVDSVSKRVAEPTPSERPSVHQGRPVQVDAPGSSTEVPPGGAAENTRNSAEMSADEPSSLDESTPGASLDSEPKSGSDMAKYPIKWTDEVKISTVNDVDALLKQEDPDGFGELAILDERKVPTNCVEWQQLHDAGYAPNTTADEYADGTALVNCRTLFLLKRGKAAGESHLRELVWDKRLLTLLPPTLVSTADPERTAAAKQAANAGRSWSQFDRGARVKRGRWPEELEITDGVRVSSTLLRAIAWGDFNDDQVDDVIVAVTNADLEGTYAEYRLVVLTRRSTKGLLEVVEVFGS